MSHGFWFDLAGKDTARKVHVNRGCILVTRARMVDIRRAHGRMYFCRRHAGDSRLVFRGALWNPVVNDAGRPDWVTRGEDLAVMDASWEVHCKGTRIGLLRFR